LILNSNDRKLLNTTAIVNFRSTLFWLIYTHLLLTLDLRRCNRSISGVSPRRSRFIKITLLWGIQWAWQVVSPSQSISGVSAVKPLVVFYDNHGRKRELLFFYHVPLFVIFIILMLLNNSFIEKRHDTVLCSDCFKRVNQIYFQFLII
jgi:hypothetical protein